MNDMTKITLTLQPGPVFYDVFLGYLRVMGSNLKDWCAPRGLEPSNVKAATVGSWNGPKARKLRQSIVEWVGEDTFQQLYHERLVREAGEAA